MSNKIDIPEGVGGRLRQERKRLGLTQVAVATQLGIHRLTQMNYESGATEPPPSYFEALRRFGFDDRYIQTGIRDDQGSVQLQASERLLLTLCDELHIPLEKVHAAIKGASAAGELQHHVANLLGSSPVLNAKNKVLVLDRDMLVDIVDGLERALAAMNKRVSPRQKAHAVASLYRMFAERGEIDPEMVTSCARSIPEI